MHPLKKYSVGLGLLILTVVVACSSAPTTSLVHQSRTPLCVLGCHVGVDIRFDSVTGVDVYVSGDTIYIHHGNDTIPDLITTYWTAGPNAEDTVISIATRVQTPDCAQACLREDDVSPNPLSLDPEESSSLIGTLLRDGNHTGHTSVTANAGAGEKTMLVTVY